MFVFCGKNVVGDTGDFDGVRGYFQAGFFQSLANGSLFKAFAEFEMSSGSAPGSGAVCAPAQPQKQLVTVFYYVETGAAFNLTGLELVLSI